MKDIHGLNDGAIKDEHELKSRSKKHSQRASAEMLVIRASYWDVDLRKGNLRCSNMAIGNNTAVGYDVEWGEQ